MVRDDARAQAARLRFLAQACGWTRRLEVLAGEARERAPACLRPYAAAAQDLASRLTDRALARFDAERAAAAAVPPPSDRPN